MTVQADNGNSLPQPLPDEDTAGFWEATAAGRLSICRCTECGAWMQPPLERCRLCGGPVEFQEVSGAGTLYSWISVNRKSVPGPQVPYQVGVAELEFAPGIRLSGMLVGADPGELWVGMDVRVELRPVEGSTFMAPVLVAAKPES